MVEKEELIATIREMLSAGVDENSIVESLKDIGLEEDKIKEAIEEAKKSTAETKEKTAEVVASKTAEEIKKHVDAHTEALALRELATHATLQEQKEKLDELSKKFSDLHKKVTVPRTDNRELTKKIAELEQEIKEVKAVSIATKELMEKILETTRKILSKL